MAYDISIMNTGSDGKVDYHFSGLGDRIVGSDKLTQHYIKHLYADDVGGLLHLIRETHNWDEGDIRVAIMSTSRHIQALQAGKNLHPAEKYAGISIDRIEIRKTEGVVDIAFTIKTGAGPVQVIL